MYRTEIMPDHSRATVRGRVRQNMEQKWFNRDTDRIQQHFCYRLDVYSHSSAVQRYVGGS